MIGNKVYGQGEIPCKILICGEGPGVTESVMGVPFCGMSGAELDWLYLKRGAGLLRQDVYVTNIVKWRTDEEDSDPTEADIARDEPELLTEIELVNPEVIVAVGKVAARWFMQEPDPDMEKLYGTPIRCPRYPDKILVVTYHPAAAIRLPERYYDKIFWAFQQVGRVVRGEIGPHPPEGEVSYEFKEFVNVFNHGLPPYGMDTEGSADNPWGLSLSSIEGYATVSKGYGAMECKPVLHNALYDIPVLEKLGRGIRVDEVEDTMLMAYLLPWLPRGLKPLAFKLTGMTMEAYEDVIAEAKERVAKDYLQKVLNEVCPDCGGSGEVKVPYKRQPSKYKSVKCDRCKGDGLKWPLPAPQLVFNDDGSGRVYKPRSIGRGVRAALERGVNLKESWESTDVEVRKHVEGKLGPMRDATLDDVDPAKAIHYSARDADATLRVYHKLEPILKKEGLWKVYEIDKGIIPIIDRMQRNGILIDRPYFADLHETFKAEQEVILNKLGELAGHSFNPASPKQVHSFLYDTLKLKPIRGADSTDEKALEGLKIRYKDREVVQTGIGYIQEYREINKLDGTYAIPLPLAADSNSRVHTRFLLHVTSSGRLSSREPNLQNQPARSERGRMIRKGFVAPEGMVLVSVDLDQIELRVGAHLSEDDNMIDIFRTGKDIHRATASLIYKKPMEEITTQERMLSKTSNFGVFYGMSAKRLQKELNLLGVTMSLDECIQFINDWFAAYPGIKEYMDRCNQQAKDLGYVECLFGRRRYLPGIYSTVDKIREENSRWAGNHPVQSTAAGLLKLWMWRIWDNILPKMARYGHCQPLLTIHDEVIFETTPDIAPVLIELVKAEAEATADLLVPISAKGTYATNWAELK